MAKKIIIYNINKYYGGTLVLSALCKTLRNLGYDARLLFNFDLNSEPDKATMFKKKSKAYLMKQSLVYYIHKLSKKIHFKDVLKYSVILFFAEGILSLFILNYFMEIH